MNRALALAAAAFLIATPIAIAQSTQAPPTMSAPPPTTQPATPPSQPNAQPTTPAPATTPAPSPSSATPAPSGEPQGCRTRKPEGEACACLSDTTRVGTSTAHPAGYNVCVRPG